MFYFRKKLIKYTGIAFFIIIFIFIYLNYAKVRSGPEITQINLEEYTSIGESSFLLKGTVKNTKSIQLNGRNIFLKKGNTFNEILVFSPGINIIEILLEDNFRKKKKYTYHIFSKTKNPYYPINLSKARKQKEKTNKEKIDKKTLNQ